MSSPVRTLPAAIFAALTGERGRRATFSFAGKSEVTLDGGAMARHIAGAAAKLRGLGLRPGQMTPILCPTSVESWTGFAGAMAAGLLPANLALPTFKTHVPTFLRNLNALLERYGTDTVLANREVIDRLSPSMSRPVRWIEPEAWTGEATAGTTPEPVSDVAFLQHSSGSTGVPKGVAMTHAAVIRHLDAYADAIALDAERDVVSTWLPLYHDMGLLTSFLLPLAKGISCRSVTPETFILNPLAFLRDAAAHRATLAWWPNFTFALLADRRAQATSEVVDGLDLSSFRGLINCSEVVMASSMDRFVGAFESHGARTTALSASYAMAENVFAVTQSPPGSRLVRARVRVSSLEPGNAPVVESDAVDTRTLVSSGRPIADVQVRIVDTERRQIPDGVVGEVAISGPFLFSEYLGLPEETAERKANGWYHTRDLGFIADSELFVLGRETDLIIVGGRKFLPNEVETIAATVRGVKAGRAVAFGVRSEEKGTEDAVAMVESPEASDATRARTIRREIIQSVLQQMDLSLADVRVVPEGTLIKTSSGKIARRDNREAFLGRRREA